MNVRDRMRATRAARGRGSTAPLLVLGLVVLAAAAWWALRPARAPHTLGSAPDPLAGTDPADAYRAGLALAQQDRDAESVPYFRRALRGVREDFWELHFNYARALYNLTIEYRKSHGLVVTRTRSSFERISLMREAMIELDRADRLARDPADLATLKSYRARMTNVWGLPWETFLAYRQAQFAEPDRRDLALQADAYMSYMRTSGTSVARVPHRPSGTPP